MSLTSTPTTYLLAACLACLGGVSAVAQATDPYATVEGEDADLQVGTRTVRSGEAVGFIKDGDYIVFEEVAFGRGPLDGEVIASSARAGGAIEFRVDAPDGPLVAEAAVTGTGGWTAFEPFAVEVFEDYADGTVQLSTRDLYLVFRGGGGFLLDVDAFSFTPADVVVTGVTIANCPRFVPVTVGAEFTLRAEVSPANAVNKTVTYSSSDPGVIAVDDLLNGELRAVSPGTATVTVVALDGGFVDECVITVIPPVIEPYLDPIPAASFTAESGTRPGANRDAVGFIQDGDFLRFDRVQFGQGPAGGTVSASSARSGGTIEFRVNAPDGLLIAEAAITGTGAWTNFRDFDIEVFEDYNAGLAFLGTRDLFLVFRGGGGFLFDVADFVFVSSEVPVEAAVINNCPGSLTVGETFFLDGGVVPANASAQSVSFGSSDDDVIRIDDFLGGEITAVAPGTATVTITAFEGGAQGTCEIAVTAAASGRLGAYGGPSDGSSAAALLPFPNPSATGRFQLSADAPEGTGTLFDALGRDLGAVALRPSGTLDLSALPDGRYFLRAPDGAVETLVKAGL